MKSVQVNDDILGALVSILKLLLTTIDTFHALSYDLHCTLQLLVQSTVQYDPIFIPVSSLHALFAQSSVCVAQLNTLY